MVIEHGGFMRYNGQRLVVPSGNYLDSKTSWSITLDKSFQSATIMLSNEAWQVPLTKSRIEVLSED